MASDSLQKRVASLEAEVAMLKVRIETSNGGTLWWEQVWGAFADDPAFEQAMRLGRKYRESQRAQHTRRPKN